MCNPGRVTVYLKPSQRGEVGTMLRSGKQSLGSNVASDCALAHHLSSE